MKMKLKPLLRLRRRKPGWDRRQAGNAARDARDWPRADVAYADYLALNPEDWAIWVQRGHAQKEAGDMAGAERCYRRAADIDPRQPDPFYQLGALMKRLERRADSVDYFRRAASLGDTQSVAELAVLDILVEARGGDDPTLLPWVSAEMLARTLLDAQAARDLRRWQEAEGLYRVYLRMRPDSPDVEAELAFVRAAARRG